MEREKSQADVAKMIANTIQYECENLRSEISSQINDAITNHIPSQNYPQDDAHSKGENDAKRQKTSEHETYMSVESSSRQNNKSEPDDDEIPTEKVSQELVDEMSHTVNEAKLRKVVDEMLRQRCTLRDERQYHIDQMQNFLKNDIIRANGSIVSITESDYKNLNKNDIEDMYLRIVNNK
ncbi:hypothetical protein Tco_0720956, partial [Tanacetum coccineum]